MDDDIEFKMKVLHYSRWDFHDVFFAVDTPFQKLFRLFILKIIIHTFSKK